MTLETTNIASAAVKITQELPLPSPRGSFDGSDAVLNGNGQFASRELPVIEPSASENKEELEARVVKVIEGFREHLEDRTRHHLGYPYNLDFDYGALKSLQNFSINNLGDPFIASNYGVHSRQFELGVLEWFARLWEISKDEYWGYITNCGTEGNLHGILVGRECLPDGILYSSKESHYSVFKAAMMYRMEAKKIETLPSGEIDCADLARQLDRSKPAIINANIGTTVKGAVDNLDEIIATLYAAGYTEDRFYIHCDGALFGLMIPFVKAAPMVTFKKPIGSVSVSGHKFVGCPTPCGVTITRKWCMEKLSQTIEYLNSRDATIMGSRNGHAPIYMWYTLTRKGYDGFQKDVTNCLQNANLLKRKLREAGITCMLNELSSTVVFERPQEEAFIRKWQLACEGPIAHAVVMPNITPEKIDYFVSDYVKSRQTHPTTPELVEGCRATMGKHVDL
eukprot:CAMPEP_0118928028 /NCGR_PEP_ID=MMETSP1169-20130426/5380_1 /TAXON_ID=36882 /ORGANISM="Pyramimonas obovata, Strain CCMP722" /LENGTH=451 /DNA_ID=CAMNT_0006869921 /DNA_START=93 /DNA_END=1451 /DNA_ORIENTATION=-